MSSRTPVRFGILGAGGIAGKFASDFEHVQGGALVAVGARAKERAEAFADQNAIPRAHESYEDLVADPDVDVVYVATPHSFHCEHTLLCLDAGKHVLCEKPLAVNSDQARRMAESAKKNERFLMEAMWMRFIPLIREIERALEAGVIGEVGQVQADFGFRREVDPTHRLFDPDLAGGALLDVGVYPLAFASLFLGPPTETTGLARMGETAVDEQSVVICRHDRGALSVLSSAIRLDTAGTATIFGSQGRIEIAAPFWKGTRAVVHRPGEASFSIDAPYHGGGYQFQALEVIECVTAGRLESPLMSLSMSLEQARTLDGVRARWGFKYPFEP